MITNAKISCSPFDIHKSKIVVVEWQFAKARKTYNCLISPLIRVVIHEKINFWKKNKSWTQMHTKLFQPNIFHKM